MITASSVASSRSISQSEPPAPEPSPWLISSVIFITSVTFGSNSYLRCAKNKKKVPRSSPLCNLMVLCLLEQNEVRSVSYEYLVMTLYFLVCSHLLVLSSVYL